MALAFLAIALIALSPSPAATAAPRGEIHVLTIDGIINPLTARYLARGLDAAQAENAELVVVRLNTPGGLETAMRDMVETIFASRLPVAVYVTPSGGRAASAGMFITMAAHVAAMAPGTNIGAAHPVGLGQTAGEVMTEKVVRDAAAFARSVATTRGRNASWAEKAVLESASISADEALDRNVIDFIANDLDALLQRLDGRSIQTTSGELTLTTTGAARRDQPMTLPERIIHALTNPNIAYLLFTLGMIGVIAELYNPGMLFPGITGVISLLVAFVAFDSLPLNWGAVLLLVLALGLFIAELYTPGTGVAAIGGVAAFVIGSLMLYQPFTPSSPAMPDVRVSPWLVVTMTAAAVASLVFVVRALIDAQRAPVRTGIQGLVGQSGAAVTPLRPEGTVRVDSEQWHAVSTSGDLEAGADVLVVGVEGVTLRVTRGGAAALHNPASEEQTRAATTR